jgi:hypothetical protein
MTFLDNTIIAERFPTDETIFATLADSMPERAGPLGKSRSTAGAGLGRRRSLVLVLEDDAAMSDAMRDICGFLDIAVERVDGDVDLLPFLQRCQPMAVVAAMDAYGQDGANVLMTVARHDPGLPVMLITDDDSVLAGAVDAVAELWGLTEVTQAGDWPAPGKMAEFLCRAGLQGRCLALLPI